MYERMADRLNSVDGKMTMAAGCSGGEGARTALALLASARERGRL
jgi:hypothetical protein